MIITPLLRTGYGSDKQVLFVDTDSVSMFTVQLNKSLYGIVTRGYFKLQQKFLFKSNINYVNAQNLCPE